MQDSALYQYLLDLKSPWSVSRVELNVKGQCVEVWAEHAEGAWWVCPQCSRELPLYDHAEERTWRHLDSCQYQTHLHARIPRVACGEHGVVQVKVPWAEAWPAASGTSRISRRPSTSTAGDSIFTHAKPGSAIFCLKKKSR